MERILSTADKRTFGLFGRAIREYDLIEDGDRIAVAVSGGKDSAALLYLLQQRLRWIPIRYRLHAIHLDMGFGEGAASDIERFCRDLGVPFHYERTDYGLRAHGPENRENPCFFCARERRKHLFRLSASLGCTKLALGHNKDDLIQTFFLNIFFSGELSTMVPKQELFGGTLTLIRPLVLLEEKAITAFVRRKGLPEIPNLCPSAGRSSRRVVKDLLNELYRQNRKIKGNIFHALSHCRPEYLPPPLKGRIR